MAQRDEIVRPPLFQPSEELHWCMLMEDHPGRGICFKVIEGVWCSAEGKYRFDCDTEEADWLEAIDWHNGVPYPDRYAQGWFKKMPFEWADNGSIMVCVSLDCESDGSCEDHELEEYGYCPEQGEDPCGETYS